MRVIVGVIWVLIAYLAGMLFGYLLPDAIEGAPPERIPLDRPVSPPSNSSDDAIKSQRLAWAGLNSSNTQKTATQPPPNDLLSSEISDRTELDPYAVALREIVEGKMNQALWGRAIVTGKGIDGPVRAAYIGLRVLEFESVPAMTRSDYNSAPAVAPSGSDIPQWIVNLILFLGVLVILLLVATTTSP